MVFPSIYFPLITDCHANNDVMIYQKNGEINLYLSMDLSMYAMYVKTLFINHVHLLIIHLMIFCVID